MNRKVFIAMILGFCLLAASFAITIKPGAGGSDSGMQARPSEDTEFWMFANGESDAAYDVDVSETTRYHDEDVDPELLEPLPPARPINPATGRPFSDEEMKRFDEIRSALPNNRLVPRILSQEEREAILKYRQEMELAHALIQSNQAGEEQIRAYFQDRMRHFREKEEYARFLIGEGKLPVEANRSIEMIIETARQEQSQTDQELEGALKRRAAQPALPAR